LGFAVFALLGAAFWGIGDFFGGLTSRRAHVLTVLVLSQAVGLVGAAAWVLASGEGPPALEDLLPAIGAGAAGALGLAALYRGMAVGAMGIVAPISAASPVVPLAVDLGSGIAPSALQWFGIAAVLGGIVVLAREPGGDAGRTGLAAGVALALLAALGFGLFVVGLDAASDAGVAWTILVVRTTSTAVALVAALLVSATLRPPARLLPAIVAIGASIPSRTSSSRSPRHEGLRASSPS
jgi:drug/metabolite transporter (DMT)-like permease